MIALGRACFSPGWLLIYVAAVNHTPYYVNATAFGYFFLEKYVNGEWVRQERRTPRSIAVRNIDVIPPNRILHRVFPAYMLYNQLSVGLYRLRQGSSEGNNAEFTFSYNSEVVSTHPMYFTLEFNVCEIALECLH